jgi:hypothetical protein
MALPDKDLHHSDGNYRQKSFKRFAPGQYYIKGWNKKQKYF